jgi:MFS family permease
MKAKKFSNVPASLKRNVYLLYAVSFFTTAGFTIPIYILFGRQYLHLSYLAAGSFFLVSWILSLALDFIGGIFADKYGRKRTFALGVVLQIAGTLPFVFITDYPLLLAASVVTGLGMALYSNTITALVYEHAHELGEMAYYQHANATTGFFSYLSRIIASLIGGFAYKLHPTLPYLLTASSLVIALIAGARMEFSPTVQEHAEQETKTKITKEAFAVFKLNPALIKFTFILTLLCIWGDYNFTYYQPYYIGLGVTSTTLGFIFAAISVFSAGGSLLMRKLPDKVSPHGINSLGLIGVAVTSTLLLLFRLPVAYFAPLVMASVSGFSYANLNLYVNKHTPNKIRSSVLSIATSTMGVGSGIGILVALRLAGHISTHVILLIAVVGSLASLGLNMIIPAKESTSTPA